MQVRLRVGELLEQQGHTAYWLSKTAGITMATAYELRDNKRAGGLTMETISKVAHALGVEPGDLFAWDTSPAQDQAA